MPTFSSIWLAFNYDFVLFYFANFFREFLRSGHHYEIVQRLTSLLLRINEIVLISLIKNMALPVKKGVTPEKTKEKFMTKSEK